MPKGCVTNRFKMRAGGPSWDFSILKAFTTELSRSAEHKASADFADLHRFYFIFSIRVIGVICGYYLIFRNLGYLWIIFQKGNIKKELRRWQKINY